MGGNCDDDWGDRDRRVDEAKGPRLCGNWSGRGRE